MKTDDTNTKSAAGADSLDRIVRIDIIFRSGNTKIQFWLCVAFSMCAIGMAISRGMEGDWLCVIWVINSLVWCWMYYREISYPNTDYPTGEKERKHNH